jgi:hypothetical protein
MRRHALQQVLPLLVLASVPCLWLAGCTRQELSPAVAAAVRTTPAERSADTAAIRLALHRHFEAGDQGSAEEQNVDLSQVSIDSDYALVTWEHEKQGGQAVLHRQAGAWTVLDSEPGWLGLHKVCRHHVSAVVAKRLLDEIDPNWPSYETY